MHLDNNASVYYLSSAYISKYNPIYDDMYLCECLCIFVYM